MMYGNHLRYAASIIAAYDGSVPLSAWLKDVFRQNKQMGSRDRKTISELIYGYYRLGHLHYDTIEERLLAGYNKTSKPGLIFPWTEQLSKGIDPEAFSNSFLIQPDLFLRIRPAQEDIVHRKLKSAGISYYPCGDNCIGLANSTKVHEVFDINAEVVIQDKNSQRTGSLMPKEDHLKVWDCCAASGGKSIMAFDMIRDVDLTVSDIRPSIINNLEQRFAQAGIHRYKCFVADVSSASAVLPDAKYDLIIADVPCSGSGTWSRTPEQLYFFKEERIDKYQQLQKKITSKIIPSIKQSGHLLYITCSVFAKENEEVVAHIQQNHSLDLVHCELFKGYQEKADTLFAALFSVRKV